ncbi:UNVERIFIED_CONTAM: hypothetical protein NY603_38565, partial [Bacteroidetes bacterium 56_B9]
FINEEIWELKQLELFTVAAPTVPGRFTKQEKPLNPFLTSERDNVETCTPQSQLTQESNN